MDLCFHCIRIAYCISEASHQADDSRARWLPQDLSHIAQNFETCPLCNHVYHYAEAFNDHPHLLNNKRIWIGSPFPNGPRISQLEVFGRNNTITIAVWAGEGTPAAIAGVSTQPPLVADGDNAAFSLYNTWLQKCCQEHEKCRRTFSGTTIDEDTGPKLPTRVLHLGDNQYDDRTDAGLKLVETGGLHGNYCALSYCWGEPGIQELLTTNETLQQHLNGIDFATLPKLFQDAVRVVRGLGIRYLWIDSLCIIQGDTSDWERESKRMAAVYSGAFVVIAASGSNDPREGCFISQLIGSPPVELPFFSAFGQRSGSFFLSIYSNCTDEKKFTSWSPLGRRGWAMQEQYLARRILYFMQVGPSWSCSEMAMKAREPDFKPQEAPPWTEVLEQYSRRELTYISDRVAALDGLAEEYQKLSGDGTYDKGIFLSQLPHSLLWAMASSASASQQWDGQPSWHWASQGGHKRFWKRVAAAFWREPAAERDDTIEAIRDTLSIEDFKSVKLEGFMRKASVVRSLILRRLLTVETNRAPHRIPGEVFPEEEPDDPSNHEDDTANSSEDNGSQVGSEAEAAPQGDGKEDDASSSNSHELQPFSDEGSYADYDQEGGTAGASSDQENRSNSHQELNARCIHRDGTSHHSGGQEPGPGPDEESASEYEQSYASSDGEDHTGSNEVIAGPGAEFPYDFESWLGMGRSIGHVTDRLLPMMEVSTHLPPRFKGVAAFDVDDLKVLDSEIHFLPLIEIPAASEETRRRWASDNESDWASDWHSKEGATGASIEAAFFDGLKNSFGLLLEPVPGHEQTYKRVGMGMISERIDEPVDEAQREAITII